MSVSEFKLIEKITKHISKSVAGSNGIGDDTAIIKSGSGQSQLFTTDVLVDGVDFITKRHSANLIGRKALAVNLSDVAAMGGVPKSFVVSLGITKKNNAAWVKKLYQGMLPLARKYNVRCVGGDISSSKQFFISIALLGEIPAKQKPILRDGARVGDWIAVTGSLGGSIKRHQFHFEPRIDQGLYLAKFFQPTSMMDISDGFLQDLGHILKRSKKSAKLDIANIPISNDARKMAKNNCEKMLAHALSDGEDFELLFTIPAKKRKKLEVAWKKKFPSVKLSFVGRVTNSTKQIAWTMNGKKIKKPELKQDGYAHF